LATPLDRPVIRECRRLTEQNRPIIVTLLPDDLISFRQKGCTATWTTTLGACFHMAVKAAVLGDGGSVPPPPLVRRK
jgi:hypothetical protein